MGPRRTAAVWAAALATLAVPASAEALTAADCQRYDAAYTVNVNDARLCHISDRPYGYQDVTLTDGRTTQVRSRPASAPAASAATILDRRVAPAPATLRFDLIRDDVSAGAPAVIVLHGGGWVSSPRPWGVRQHADRLARAMAYRGYAAFTADYAGGSEAQLARMGLEPIARESQRSLQTLVRFIRANAATLGVDPARIYVVGESAGAHLALRLALRSDDPGNVAARNLPGVADRTTPSTVTAALSTVGFDCGVPGAAPPVLRMGRKVPGTGWPLQYAAAPDVSLVVSTRAVTMSPLLRGAGNPNYRWSGGADDLPMSLDVDQGFGRCTSSAASRSGDAPFAMVVGAEDETVPLASARATCLHAGRLCDAFVVIDRPDQATFTGAGTYAIPTNLPLSAWPAAVVRYPGVGADHYLAQYRMRAQNGAQVQDYDRRLTVLDELDEQTHGYFCMRGARARVCTGA